MRKNGGFKYRLLALLAVTLILATIISPIPTASANFPLPWDIMKVVVYGPVWHVPLNQHVDWNMGIYISNPGPANWHNVVVTDELSALWQLERYSASVGTVSVSVVAGVTQLTWSIPDLPPSVEGPEYLMLWVGTRVNLTEHGCYLLNPGAILNYDEAPEPVSTPPIWVSTEGLTVVTKVDFNNDGVYSDSETYYAGSIAHWRATVTNTGNVTVTQIKVTDSNGHDYGPTFDLAPGASVQFNYDSVVTAETYTNVAADGQVCGPGFTSDYAVAVPIAPNTDVSISSSANQVYAGGSVALSVSEANTGQVVLTNPRVELAPLGMTLTNTSSSYVGGDINSNGKLDIGETWSWNVAGVTVSDTTVYTATGHGIDTLNNDVTFPGYASEQDQVVVSVVAPDTEVSITSSAGQVYAGGSVDLLVGEANSGNVALTSPRVEVAPLGLTLNAASSSFTGGDANNDGMLDTNETWSWKVTGVAVSVATTFTATGHGNDPFNNDVTFPQYPGEQSQVTVSIIKPDTVVAITPSKNEVDRGSSIDLAVSEANTGDVPLTDPRVVLEPLAMTLDETSASFTGGDIDNDGVLDVDETWTWNVTGVTVNDTTTYTATGHGNDPLGNDVTFPQYNGEQAQATVSIVLTPGISLTKSADKDSAAPGERVTYTYVVKNTGGVTLTNVVVTDDGGTPGYTGDDFIVGTVATLSPGEEVTFTVTTVLPLQMVMVVNGQTIPVGQLITQLLSGGNVKVTYIQSRNVVDNTYGVNAVGYPSHHNFLDLIGSDAAGFRFTDGTGAVVLDFVADYISSSSAYPSGYGTLGVSGGDGSMVRGSASNVLSVMTSITQDLNQSPAFYGYIVDSPPEPNSSWDYNDSYTVVVSGAAFGASGFGTVTIPYVHDSPSKLGFNKIIPVPSDSSVTNLATVTATANGSTLTAVATDTVSIGVSQPNTKVTISSSACGPVTSGSKITLTVTEKNTGTVPLTNPRVDLAPLGMTLVRTSATYFGGDANNNGILDVAETWTWKVTNVMVSATTTYVATGHGIDPKGVDITYPAYPSEQAKITVTVSSGQPNTKVTISSSASGQVTPGAKMTLTITEKNTGTVVLTNPYVDLAPLGVTLNKTSSSYVGGDSNNNGKLDVGERWTWKITNVTVSAATTYVATGHGIDPAGVDITYPAYPYEQASVTVAVKAASPNTKVSITSSACTDLTPGSKITLTVTEKNTGNVTLTNPRVDLAPLGVTLNKASASYIGGDSNSNGKLDPGETWKWKITNVAVSANTSFVATGHGIDPAGVDITYPAYPYEQSSVTVAVKAASPNTKVSITSSACGDVVPGSKITLTVTEKNTGNVTLTNPYVELAPLAMTLNKASASYIGGDSNSNGKLDPGEVWTWKVANVTVSANTTYVATGHGVDATGADITYPAYPTEQAKVTVTTKATAGATRTPGYWMTHLDAAAYVFTHYLRSDINIGFKDIKNVPDLMGMFWASNPQNSDGSSRTTLGQARQTTAFQVVAAILNTGLPNGAPLPVSLAEIRAIMSGTDIDAIRALGQTLDAYNNSGDNVAISGQIPGKATPKAAQAIADIAFADSQ